MSPIVSKEFGIRPTSLKPFDSPIFVTRPILPDLNAVHEKLEAIWASQWLTNHGHFHNELEARLEQELGVGGVSVVNNGTIGLLIALRALDIREGEVITTPFTFAATPHAISWNGLDPVFCDIRPDTYCIDASKIEPLITERTKAILGVHVFGFPCEVDAIEQVANKYGLKVIYDAAHAFLSSIGGQPISRFGDVSVFSFHATKLFHSVEGGCLAYNDPALREAIYLLRNFGIRDEDTVVDIGINGKLNEVQAAVGLLVLDMVEQERELRAKVHQTYMRRLVDIDGLILPEQPAGTVDSFQYFPIRVVAEKLACNRDQLHEQLKQYNVITRKYFYPLCSDYSPYRDLPSSSAAHLPIANQIKSEVLCLPYYGGLADGQAERICDIIRHLCT